MGKVVIEVQNGTVNMDDSKETSGKTLLHGVKFEVKKITNSSFPLR